MEIFFVGSVNGNGNLLEDRNGGFKCMFQRTAEIDWGHMHIHPSLFFFFLKTLIISFILISFFTLSFYFLSIFLIPIYHCSLEGCFPLCVCVQIDVKFGKMCKKP